MGIGSLLTDWVEDRVQDWRDRLFGWTAAVLRAGFDFFFEGLEAPLMPLMKTMIERLKTDPKTPDEAKPILEDLAEGRHPFQLLLVIPMAAAMIIAMVSAALGPFMRLMYYEEDRIAKSARMDPQTATMGFFRIPEKESKFESDLRDTGWTDGDIEEFRRIYKPLLKPDEIRQLILRGEDPAGVYRAELVKAGYSESDVEGLVKLYEVIPPLADMVRFADFSAFDPEVIEKWREFYDAPDWVKEPFGLIGIFGEWVNRYYFSHWRQPGRFELGELHRRFEIDDDTIKLAYKTQGYSAFWQDLLLLLVREPLTRVDIRRMHDVGMLSDEKLSELYHIRGFYGEENRLMVEFTKRYNAATQRSVTESKILKAYRTGDLDELVALELLEEIGYSEDDAAFVLATEDDDKVETRRDLTTATIKSLYLNNVKDRLATTEKLADLDYPAEAIADLFDLWDLEKIPPVRNLTRSELTHFLGEGFIKEPQFWEEMAIIGYPDKYINLYLQEHTAEELAAAQVEEARARKEQERVAAAAVTTRYEEDRARLDVDIAARRTYIAEKRLAALRTEDEELVAAIKEDIAAARVAIAELQEEKAKLKL